jgi:decaprenyl-phosphate phosphoribosyltransferase
MRDLLRLMRPVEWIKNVIVLAGPAFSLHLTAPGATFAFAAFCLTASACYVINDLADREADRAHPTKRHRPIASGAVSVSSAITLAVVLVVVAFGMSAWFLPRGATATVVAYFLLILAYSFALKRRPILDVMIIAIGFVLRAVGGAAAVDVPVSPWLIACTFTLCMFLGFGKRTCELATLAENAEAGKHRATLRRYSPQLLGQLTSVSAGIAIMTFLLYTMDSGPAALHPPFKKEWLLYTLPLVAYGLFRYTMLVESGRFTGPTQIVTKDRGLLITGVLWVVIVGAILALTHEPLADRDKLADPVAASTISTVDPGGQGQGVGGQGAGGQ